jgi:transcriptional regulator with XRE-family HTH domain
MLYTGLGKLTGCPMYGNPQHRNLSDVQQLRREGGRWLKERRESLGLSQRQLAELVGAEYYTFISQLETGRGRIPPDRYDDWGRALKMRGSDFVRQILRYYDPITYNMLFNQDDEADKAVHKATQPV